MQLLKWVVQVGVVMAPTLAATFIGQTDWVSKDWARALTVIGVLWLIASILGLAAFHLHDRAGRRPEGSQGDKPAPLVGPTGIATALSPEVFAVSDELAVMTPPPGSSNLPHANFRTHGRSHFAFDYFHRRLRELAFTEPERRTVRRTDRLPVRLACGKGELVIEKFTDEGFVVDEIDTEGDRVAFVVVFDD